MSPGPRFEAPRHPLSELALRLRNASPEVWDMFVREFDAYTNEGMSAMSEAPPDKILIAQGRVQQCRALLRLFKECDVPNRKPTPQ